MEKESLSLRDMVASAHLLRQKFLSDSARPRYHFAIPEDNGIPGDANGAFYARGRYHLMYLYNCCLDSFRWGHMSSTDMIHWTSHPDALFPDELDGGIFSGGAFVDEDETVYLTYWSINNKDNCGGIRIARSTDKEHNYEIWEKFDSFAVPCTVWGAQEIFSSDGEKDYLCAADPSNIWKKDGYYYMQTGNLCILNLFRDKPDAPKKYLGDHTDLFRSKDMKHWEFAGRFYERKADNSWTDESEDDMCPSFLPLPASPDGGVLTDQYLQLFIAHNKGAQYYIGSYENDRFYPTVHGRMSWKDNTYFAPEALITPDGRQVAWAWLLDNREHEFERFGWSGVYALPRSLWFTDDHTLGIRPIRELETLRYHPATEVADVDPISCELHLTFAHDGADHAGVNVRMSRDGSEYTSIYYDAQAKMLVFDAEHSGTEGRCITECASFALKAGEDLSLTVFIDHSVIDVFANDRQAITRRVYPAESSIGISPVKEEALKEKQFYSMMPSNFC